MILELEIFQAKVSFDDQTMQWVCPEEPMLADLLNLSIPEDAFTAYVGFRQYKQFTGRAAELIENGMSTFEWKLIRFVPDPIPKDEPGVDV